MATVVNVRKWIASYQKPKKITVIANMERPVEIFSFLNRLKRMNNKFTVAIKNENPMIVPYQGTDGNIAYSFSYKADKKMCRVDIEMSLIGC